MICNFFFALAMAASALSSPLTKRDLFNCNVAYVDCVADPYSDTTYCNNTRNACETCWQSEQACRVSADYSQGIQCTVTAQLCYHEAESVSTVQGAYNCDAAYSTCIYAPNTNSAFCSVQLDACKACESQENQCRTAPEANQAYCSSLAAGCFNEAITSNGTYSGSD